MPASSWIPYANKGRPAVHRFVVEQCHKIPIPTLLKGMSLGQQQIQVGPLTATVYLSDRGPSYLHIGNRQFELRSIPVHFGGSYWLLRCPLTGKLRWHLFIDPEGNIGSRDSLDLTYAERRMIVWKRRTWNRVKLWAELHGEKATPNLAWFESHPDAIPTRPGTWMGPDGTWHSRRMRQSRYERALRKLSRTRRRSR
jgi:hypothetical protein